MAIKEARNGDAHFTAKALTQQQVSQFSINAHGKERYEDYGKSDRECGCHLRA